MKFGKTLFRNHIPEWSRHYLSYKGLKKEIKNGQQALANGDSTLDDVVTAFIFHLDREVEKVNGYFIYKRSELERRLRILSEKSRRLNPNANITSSSLIPPTLPAAIPTASIGSAPLVTAPSSTDQRSLQGPGSALRLDLSILTTPKIPIPSSNASLIPPSPFISDPEADAECLQAMLDTKEMISKISWFAEMNRRAVEKILKKFDKRMATVSRDDYLRTKVNTLAFVFDGQLQEMTINIDVLIREMNMLVADHPPFKSGLSPKHASAESRMGLTEQQIEDALSAIEHDDAGALKGIIDSHLKLRPELEGALRTSVQFGRLGQLPRSLFRKACEEQAFQCIAFIMSFGTGALMANVNEQTVLHKLAIEGGNFTKSSSAEGVIDDTQMDNTSPQLPSSTAKDDPELITFILKELSALAEHDALCALKSTADIFGRRPLHYAAMHGYPKITRALINDLKASGEFIDFSDPYWFDSDGFTPLIYAVTKGEDGVLRVLVEEGGIQDVDAITEAYVSLPSLPKVMPSTPMTVLNPLIGSDVNLHAVYTYTPLSIACRMGHVDVAKLLISYGANLDTQDEDGESCLIIASKSGHIECAKLLIAGRGEGKGANLELRERYYGWTALHLAAIENHPAIVKILLDAGANANVFDYSAWNPHEHAVFAANNACAALLRPVSWTLDERLRSLKLGIGSNAGGASPNISLHSQPTIPSPTMSAMSSPKLPKSDSPPSSGGKSNVKLSKTVQRAYGHKYLEDESLIVVTLGSNDIRSTVEPVELYMTDDSHSFLTASTAFSLEVTAENAAAGEKVIIDLPLKDSSYHEQIVFYAAKPEDTILNFSVYPTFGPLSSKLVGRGTAILSSLDNLRKDVFNQHPGTTSLQGMNMTIPIFGVENMEIIGRVRVEFNVVRPFKHENLKIGSKHTYWKSLTTTVIGHRGLGMNRRVANLQVGENTLLSFVTAANLGAEYVEFDVQMTKDMVPVLYHDWTVTETGLDIPVSAITLEQFQNLSKKKARGHSKRGSQPSSPKPDQQRLMAVIPPPSTLSVEALPVRPELTRRLTDEADIDAKDGSNRLMRSNSLGAISRMKSLSTESESANAAAKMKGNGLGTIQAPFATLKDVFETISSHTGFNIEVKYPMLDEAEDANIPLYSFEMNRFVDRILKEVYDHDQTHPDRNIIFSSFHPDICLLLNLKQPNYPVFFLTDAGTSAVADRRCNSIQGAVRFATSIDLLGIVAHSPPIIEAPNLIKGIKETGLLVFTYGADNNDVENVKLQKRHGVDAVIVDCVLAVRKGLQQPE